MKRSSPLFARPLLAAVIFFTFFGNFLPHRQSHHTLPQPNIPLSFSSQRAPCNPQKRNAVVCFLTFPRLTQPPRSRYAITGLKSLARRKYASQLFDDNHWSSRTAEFADSMIEVYESTVDTDRGLRDLVIQAFREHPELARSKDIELVVRDTPDAAWELFRLGWGLPIC